MSPPAALRELHYFTRAGDADGLRETLAHSGEGLAALRLNGQQHRLAELDDDELVQVVRHALHQHKLGLDAARRSAGRRKSSEAVQQLVVTAKWNNDHVELDPGLLLGDVLADGTKKFIGFVVDAHLVAINRRKLMEVRRAARCMPGLRVSVEYRAVRFRWKDGKGGLNLFPQSVRPDEQDRVLHVVLEPPAVEPAPLPEPKPERTRARDGAWLGEVLNDVLTSLLT